MSGEDADDMVRINVRVPKTVRDTVTEKLPHGGLSNEVRESLRRIAFGEDLNKRSRLERRKQDLRDDIRDLRSDRSDIDSEIERREREVTGIEEKLSNITTAEDKFEAKIDELESRLRSEGMRIYPDSPAVRRAAETGEVENEYVIEILKQRNPDVPDFAFRDGVNDFENDWNALPDGQAALSVDEREERYRGRNE